MHKPPKQYHFIASLAKHLMAGFMLLVSLSALAADDIVIGVIVGLTGSGASYGANIVNGAKMAVRDLNSAGGINGRRIRLKIIDDASEPARSAIAMRRLVASSPDLIVGGWGSPQVIAHMDFAEESAIPYIVVSATHPKITKPQNRWIFRVIQSDTVMASQLATLATGKLGLKRIAIINDSNIYGSSSRDLLKEALENLGINPVEIQSYQNADRDFHIQLQQIKLSRPDGIAILGTLPAAAFIMQQARTLDIDARFIGLGGLANDALMKQATAAAEGTVLMSFFDEESDEMAQNWSQRYKREFSGQSQLSPLLGAWEYRAIHDIAAPCLRTSGTNRENLRACIAGWRGSLFGINTEVYFDNSGQLVQPPLVVEVRANAFHLLKVAQ